MASAFFFAQHQMRIFFSEFPTVLWTAKTGGSSQNEVTQTWPGGGNTPINVIGPTTVEQVTLTKPFDPVVDRQITAWVRAWDQGARRELTLVCQPVDAAGVPLVAAAAVTYAGCAKVSFRNADGTRGGSEATTIELVVQPRQIV